MESADKSVPASLAEASEEERWKLWLGASTKSTVVSFFELSPGASPAKSEILLSESDENVSTKPSVQFWVILFFAITVACNLSIQFVELGLIVNMGAYFPNISQITLYLLALFNPLCILNKLLKWEKLPSKELVVLGILSLGYFW